MEDLRTGLPQLLAHARRQEELFIERLPGEARAAPGTYEAWSVRDLIAYAAAWKERTAHELAAAVGTGPAPPGENLEHVNAAICDAHPDWAWRQVPAISRQAHDDLVKQVERMTTEDLAIVGVPEWHQEPLWALAVDDGFSHPFTHMVEYYPTHGGDALAASIRQEADARLARFNEGI